MVRGASGQWQGRRNRRDGGVYGRVRGLRGSIMWRRACEVAGRGMEVALGSMHGHGPRGIFGIREIGGVTYT